MAHIFWTADLDTGFQDIDEQHKQLVHYINELHNAHETNNTEKMNINLFDLISCTMNHFAYEEEMLAKAGYHLLEPRKRMHHNFVNKLVEYQVKMLENENVIEELLTTLDGWLFQHIRVNDKGYVQAVINSGIYAHSEQNNQPHPSDTDETLLANATSHDAPSPNTVDSPIEPSSPSQTAWERLVAQHEQKRAQDDDNDKPRGWAATF